jgi:hypothetical protein
VAQIVDTLLTAFDPVRSDLPDNLLKSLLESYDQINEPFRELRKKYFDEVLRLAPPMKDAAFQEEAEWRLVSTRTTDASSLRFRPARLALTPYHEFSLCENGQRLQVRAIVAGPSPDILLSFQSAQLASSTYETDCKYWTWSAIPYREVR